MKIAVAAVAALAAGVLGGSVVGGVRAKASVMEAMADSLAVEAPVDPHEPAASASHDDAAEVDPDPDGTPTDEAGTDEIGAQDADPSHPETPDEDPSESPDPQGSPSESGAAPAAVESAGDAESDTPAARPDPSGADSASAREEGARKLSKIFGAMKADDAAAVLSELTDGEIEMILRHMSERLAAPILEAFEPARAAALSRIVLNSGGNG